MHCWSNLLLMAALIAPSATAVLIPRQGTSSSTSGTSDSVSSTATSSSATALSTFLPTTSQPSATSVAASATTGKPIVSVENSGVLTTITPTMTGTSLTALPTGISNSTVTNSTSNTGICTADNYALNGTAAPFCLPANGTAWIKNTSYPVTWNPEYWPGYTGNIVLALLYTGKDGSNVITQNSNIANSAGYANIDIDESWLNGNTVVAARLLIAPNEATSVNSGAHWGPTVTLQESEVPFNTSPPEFNSSSLAVQIAVPICVVAAILLLLGLCYFTRKHRTVPLFKIPRTSQRGYAEGRGRRARAGEKRGNEFELGTVSGGYRDEPTSFYADLPEDSNRNHHT